MNAPENGFRAPLVEELASMFPGYEILSLIATGGMGAVYHAVQSSLEREVAIKILPVEFGKDKEFREGFETEAKAMAKLNHPNLIGVHDFGDVDGMLYIVMEYVPGQSLHDACAGVPIDSKEATRIITEICHGLAHAHEQGILHRDIKPANILLNDELEPKIGDFGLARPVDAQAQEEETIYGTPGYTAPEVVDSPHAVDHRADIFSLGVLLHEMLTAQLPESDPRPPSAISYCDSRLDEVVGKATQPDPSMRYQNATEMVEVLENIASSTGPRLLQATSPIGYQPPATQAYTYQPAKKRNGGMIAAILLLVGVLVVFFLRDRIFNGGDPSSEPETAVGSQPEPIEPDPITPTPEPVKPDPEPSVVFGNPFDQDPEPSVALGNPFDPDPDSTVTEPKPEPIKAQPKYDVEGFLAHARSVMIERCDPEIEKHDEALKKNLSDFRENVLASAKGNLQEKWHDALSKEVDEYLYKCELSDNRLIAELEKKLKPKKWIVELHEQHLEKEPKIDAELTSAFAKHQKTYLYGLDLKLKKLEKEDDPVAVDLLKAEIQKLNESSDYFKGLMRNTEKRS